MLANEQKIQCPPKYLAHFLYKLKKWLEVYKCIWTKLINAVSKHCLVSTHFAKPY